MDGSSSSLVTKLSRFVPLSDEDVPVLNALCVNEERSEAGTDIVLQGDVPRSAFVLTHGMAFRYRLLPNFADPNSNASQFHRFLRRKVAREFCSSGPPGAAVLVRDA